jgi:hypothetical protein
LHQAIKMAENDAIADIIAEIGPEICSSDGSDSCDSEEEMEDVLMGNAKRACVPSWQGPALTSCLAALGAEGLYYSGLGRHAGSGILRPSRRPPPDGTPLSWISDSYSHRLPF